VPAQKKPAPARPARASKRSPSAESTPASSLPEVRVPRIARLADLQNHPRNYREHPEDQVRHVAASMRQNGVYRNVVVANDGKTLLAGHGVVKAARHAGLDKILVVDLPYAPDDPRALKVLAADNEVANLAEVDDRLLTEILKEVKEFDMEGLLGTGVDESMLANMVFVTRPASEVKSLNEAAEWVGMPEFQPEPPALKVVVQFKTDADRKKFLELIGYDSVSDLRPSLWWPKRAHDDLASVKFEG
jgi:hypothetical protein